MVLNSVFSHFLVCQKSVACNSPLCPAEGRRVRWKPVLEFWGVRFASALSAQTERFSAHSAAERCVLIQFMTAKYSLILSTITKMISHFFKTVWFISKVAWSLGKSEALWNVSHLSKYLKSNSQIRLALPGKQHNYLPPKMFLSLIKIKCCVM